MQVGDLLKTRGFAVTNNFNTGTGGSTVQDIRGAIEQGKDVIVGVDGARLWLRKNPISTNHAILVTGVVTDTRTNQTLGFYINDSMRGEGGKIFVPLEKFQYAWNGGENLLVTASASR